MHGRSKRILANRANAGVTRGRVSSNETLLNKSRSLKTVSVPRKRDAAKRTHRRAARNELPDLGEEWRRFPE